MAKDTQSKKAGSSPTVLKNKSSRIFSAGGIVYRQIDNQILWFVRKTVASKLYPDQHWMLPKGWIDDAGPYKPGPMASGLIKADKKSLEDSAIREVREEGGFDAKIIKKIGTYFFSYNDPKLGKTLKFVTFFLMEYLNELPAGHDWETAEIAWLSFNEAGKILSFGGEKQMLKKAQELLADIQS